MSKNIPISYVGTLSSREMNINLTKEEQIVCDMSICEFIRKYWKIDIASYIKEICKSDEYEDYYNNYIYKFGDDAKVYKSLAEKAMEILERMYPNIDYYEEDFYFLFDDIIIAIQEKFKHLVVSKI